MIVIHVARKPPGGSVAQAVAQHGTGGINIDGCRIAAEKVVGWGGRGRDQTVMFLGALVKDGAPRPKEGRWPANLILEHQEGCQLIGTVEDPQLTHNQWDDGSKPFGDGAGHAYTKVEHPPLPIDVWVCAEGCPAAKLDEQSGYLPSTRVHNRGVHKPFGPFLDQGKPIDRVCGYEDAGGASRFFKQVKP